MLKGSIFSFTKWNAAGESWALCLSSGGTVALQHAVIQQVARTSIGERSAFELYCIHLMDETAETQVRQQEDEESRGKRGRVYNTFIIICYQRIDKLRTIKNWLVTKAMALPVSIGQQVPGGGRCGRDVGSFTCYRTLTAAERRCWSFLACWAGNKHMEV